MPLEPLVDYDDPDYPTLAEFPGRRAFLRRVGLSAIAAALGLEAIGCDRKVDSSQKPRNESTNKSSTGGPSDPPPLAGTPPPPRWPGSSGALVGGGPIKIRFADATSGVVAVAVVFDPENSELEGKLLDAESKISDAVIARFAKAPPDSLSAPAQREAIEDELLARIREIVASPAIESVTIAKLTDESIRPVPRAARSSEPPSPSGAAPSAPAAAAAPPPRRLPRAGDKCPLHPDGCNASEGG